MCWFNTSSYKAPKVFIWGNTCEAGGVGAEELAESSDGMAIWPLNERESKQSSVKVSWLWIQESYKMQWVLLKLCPGQRTLHLPGTDPLKCPCCTYSLARAPCGRVASLQHPWWISRYSGDRTFTAKRGLRAVFSQPGPRYMKSTWH